MKQVYSTFILKVNDNSEHPFLVCVPDMDILTEGSSFADAIEKAKQYFEDIDFSSGILTYVDVDFTEYRKKRFLEEQHILP
jgi:hypothetical protein